MRIGVVILLLLAAAAAGCDSPGGGGNDEPTVTEFVELGTMRGRPPAPIELTGTAGETFYRALTALTAKENEQARTALTGATGGDGVRAFAFVKSGCAQTGAVPVLSGDRVDVRLTGEKANCAVPNYFLVIVWAVDPQRRLRLPG